MWNQIVYTVDFLLFDVVLLVGVDDFDEDDYDDYDDYDDDDDGGDGSDDGENGVNCVNCVNYVAMFHGMKVGVNSKGEMDVNVECDQDSKELWYGE